MFHYSDENTGFSANHGYKDSIFDGLTGKHFHDRCELYCTVTGNTNYNIDGEIYTLEPYDVLFIPAGKYHFPVPVDDTVYENYVFTFDYDFSPKVREVFSAPQKVNIAKEGDVRRLMQLLDHLFETFSDEDFGESAVLISRQMLICFSYIITANAPLASDAHGMVAKVVEYIDKNIEKELNADVIAQKFNFSKSYVQNQFSHTMKIGLQQYIHYKKIYRADDDIQNGMMPFEAAEKYGYNNYLSFYRQYVKVFGKSPYRRKK